MEEFWIISFILVWLIVALYLGLYYFIIFRIKHAHQKLWELLGRPDFFVRNNLSMSKSVWRFIDQRKDLELEDKTLSKSVFLLTKMKALRFVCIGYFILFVVFHIVKNKII
jgi:Na+/melibiose symporter-like transporter